MKRRRPGFRPWLPGLAGLGLLVVGSSAPAQEAGGVLKLPLPPDGGGEMEFCAVPVGPGGEQVFRSGAEGSGVSWDLRAGGAFTRDGKAGPDVFYYLGKFEVTRGQWAQVMGEPRPESTAAQLPQIGVTWPSAQRFLARCNEWLLKRRKLPTGLDGTPGVLRLPTEGEWEYAARGGNSVPEDGKRDEFAWHLGNSAGRLMPVGRKRANNYGLHDMLGNARELLGDAYRTVPGWGPVGGLVLKGGDAWSEPAELDPRRRGELSWRATPAEAGRVGVRVMIGLAEAGGLKETRAAKPSDASLDALNPATILERVRERASAGAADFPALLPDRVETPLPGGTGVMGFRAVRVGREGKGTVSFTAGDATGQAGSRPDDKARRWVSGSCRDRQGWLYYLGEKEVSRGQWRKVMGLAEEERPEKGGSDEAMPIADVTWPEVELFLERYNAWIERQPTAGSRLPVTVGGKPAVLRLPTEAEWEYAARGGAAVDLAQFEAVRWYPLAQSDQYESAYRGGERVVYPTGSRKPNPLGLYDMLGNVSEMTQEWFQSASGEGRLGGVCVRGGSARSETPEELRASIVYERRLYDRETGAPARSPGVGFRLALGAPWIVSPCPAPVPTAPLASSARWGSGSFLAALVGLALGGQFAFGGWRFWEMPPRTQLKWAVRANLFGALLAGAPALVGLAEPISQRLLAWSAGLGVSPWMAALALGALAGLVSYWPLRGAELGAKFACQPLLRGRTQVHLFMARRHLARRRETEAAQWFVKAANAGNAEAQYQMGSMYETGRGVATNNQVAFTWYLAAARQSSAPAKLKLVEMYQQGRGVARNWEEAWKWREREAEHRSSGGPLFRAVVAAAVLVVFGAIAIVANLLSGGSHGEPRVEKKAPLVHATPAPARALTPTPSVPEADVPFVNSLGMKFLHVPTARGSRVLFSVWETRVQDYEAFASETRRTWQKPSFPQGPTHPAVNVTWQDAVAFCAWLSKKEGRTYRLPTDAEWSEAVGLPVETGGTPEEKNANSAGGYPWGKEFPPPQGAGNYGSSLKVDSFENTAPVASFGPNALGLYDLSGNVWEWCEDWVRGKFDFRVVRGGSWDDAGTSLRSSWRGYAQPSSSSERLGFRCVLVSQTPGPAAAQPIALPLRIPSVIVIPPPKPSPPKTARAELPAPSPADQPSPTDPRNPPTFTNSLGQKFVSVPNTAVLFCLWPTRVQDFAVFAKETAFRNYSWKNPGFKQDPDHPVVNVTWNDAVAFCKWLTDRDRKKGFLSKDQLYRLPTDLEWSKAVGLAEETGQTPEARDMAVPDVFPWGTQWPPPPNVGNYSGEETGSDVAIKGYDDGFAWTSPVGTFPANKYGLYDVGGNVWQWCMDNSTNESKTKVLRGGSWYNGALRLSLLSSCRVSANPDSSTDNYGFRIVRAPVNPQAAARPSSQGGLAPAPISTPRLATPAKKAASATPKPR